MTPEEPLMVAISTRTGFHPEEISRHSFPAGRRGFEQEAVRQYLQALAGEVREMLDREQALRRKVAEAERRAAEPELDEATLMRAVGVETAKILQAAHDAAQEVVAKAEARAAEIVGAAESVLASRQEAAEAEATAIIEASQLEAEAVTESARQEAVSLLQATKAECRRIVREAKALRGEILGDLAEKRRGLRVQLEELRAGRDFLIEVVESVGSAVGELLERVASAEHDARVAAAAAGEAAEQSSDDSDLEAVVGADEGLLAEGALGLEAAEELSEAVRPREPAGAESYEEADSEEESTEEDHLSSRRSVEELFARIRADRRENEAEPGGEPGGEAALAEPTPLGGEPGRKEAAAGPEPAGQPSDEIGPDLKAAEPTSPARRKGRPGRPASEGELPGEGVLGIHSAHEADVRESDELPPVELDEAGKAGAETPVAPGAAEAEELPSDDEAALTRRAELLGPVTGRLSRALKRALQDDQNLLLDAIRHSSGRPELEKLLPAEAQRSRIEEATAKLLADAWSLGHRWLSGAEPADGSPASAGSEIASELAAEVSGLLRHRLEEALEEVSDLSEGATEAAGASYREWRRKRVEQAAGDFAVKSFSKGAVAGGAGTAARWVVDDEGQPCPDCDDNALAGPVAVGEEFPTGQLHPPVHPGCRCLLVPATS